jgi:PRC-barrel domain
MARELLNIATWVMLTALAVSPARAQSLRDPSSLIGAPVLAADGASIGRVADIATAENGQIEAIRVRTGAALGFGERMVLIPQPAFMIKGGRVWLPDLTAQDVESFPDAHSEREDG